MLAYAHALPRAARSIRCPRSTPSSSPAAPARASGPPPAPASPSSSCPSSAAPRSCWRRRGACSRSRADGIASSSRSGAHLAGPTAAILADLPARNLLVEPVPRNTAPCIGWAAARVARARSGGRADGAPERPSHPRRGRLPRRARPRRGHRGDGRDHDHRRPPHPSGDGLWLHRDRRRRRAARGGRARRAPLRREAGRSSAPRSSSRAGASCGTRGCSSSARAT